MSKKQRDLVSTVDAIKEGRIEASANFRAMLKEDLKLMNPKRDTSGYSDQELAGAWWNEMLSGGWDIVWPLSSGEERS